MYINILKLKDITGHQLDRADYHHHDNNNNDNIDITGQHCYIQARWGGGCPPTYQADCKRSSVEC